MGDSAVTEPRNLAAEIIASGAAWVAKTHAKFGTEDTVTIIRENIRVLTLALGELDSHDAAADFLDLMSLKQTQLHVYETEPVAADLPAQYPSEENIIQFRPRSTT